MELTVLLEAVMVACFGISWPASLLKSYRSRSTKGKSLFFLWMIAIGYAAGILWKLLEFQKTGSIKYPTVFYVINLLMVLGDIVLYHRNKRLEADR